MTAPDAVEALAAALRRTYKSRYHERFAEPLADALAAAGYRIVREEEGLRERAHSFALVRDVDATGISGTGRVAQGFLFEDGTVALRWLTEHRSTALYTSIDEVDAIHGHNGSTRIVWDARLPAPPPALDAERLARADHDGTIALSHTCGSSDEAFDDHMEWHKAKAAAIAAAYEREGEG